MATTRSATTRAAPHPYVDPQAHQAQFGTITVSFRKLAMQVRNLKTSNRVDVKDAAGADGATITHHGRKPATFTIELRSWDPEGFELLQQIVDLAHSQPDEIAKAPGRAPALTIAHPLLARRGISAVYVDDIEGPEDQGGGVCTASISCIQWTPAPKKTAKPKISTLKVADVPTAFNPPKPPPKVPLPSKSGGPPL
jgi:hypothetical protein